MMVGLSGTAMTRMACHYGVLVGTAMTRMACHYARLNV